MTFFLVIHVQVSRAGELHQKKFRRFIPKNLEGLFDPETKWSPLHVDTHTQHTPAHHVTLVRCEI